MKLIATAFAFEDLLKFKQAHVDAVVISDSFYSVRGVINVSKEEIIDWKQACDKLQLELFVLVNRFFYEEELTQVKQYLAFLKELQVDGIYYSDECVLEFAIELEMQHLLIYQGDTLITNHLDVNAYLEEGLKSVVLAKEITLEEIRSIAKQSDAQKLEIMIHGHMLMMYSRRTLLTNYFNFLGQEKNLLDNRNLSICENTRDQKMPIYEDCHGTHIFTGFIQEFFDEIKELKELGIGYVKVDGIFETSLYVLDMISFYNQLLQGTTTVEKVRENYKNLYPNHTLWKGFLYTKTSKTK